MQSLPVVSGGFTVEDYCEVQYRLRGELTLRAQCPKKLTGADPFRPRVRCWCCSCRIRLSSALSSPSLSPGTPTGSLTLGPSSEVCASMMLGAGNQKKGEKSATRGSQGRGKRQAWRGVLGP